MKWTVLDFSFNLFTLFPKKPQKAEENEKEVMSEEDDVREAEDVSLVLQCWFRQVEKVPNFVVSQALSYSSNDQFFLWKYSICSH